MLYRRRVLLAVIETFGSNLGKKDFQKLLLLYCRMTKQSYYDFFPHKYGNFSFTAEQDREYLIQQGFLRPPLKIAYGSQIHFFDQLTPSDQEALNKLAQEIGSLRGSQLVRKAYLAYPVYARRSLIIDKVLSPEESHAMFQSKTTAKFPCLFTIGYESLSIDAYLQLLLEHDIAALVDVRNNPLSRKFGFSKNRLADYTQRIGIDYVHFPELGIPSSLRKNLGTTDSYETLFQYYSDTILPREDAALQNLIQLCHRYQRAALTCFELDQALCHRSRLTDFLVDRYNFAIPVRHLTVRQHHD